jgi:hypothetical protein
LGVVKLLIIEHPKLDEYKIKTQSDPFEYLALIKMFWFVLNFAFFVITKIGQVLD